MSTTILNFVGVLYIYYIKLKIFPFIKKYSFDIYQISELLYFTFKYILVYIIKTNKLCVYVNSTVVLLGL